MISCRKNENIGSVQYNNMILKEKFLERYLKKALK